MEKKDDTNYIFAEKTVKYSNNLPLEDILNMGNAIWKDIKKTKKNETDDDSIYNIFYEKYKDFATSFPLVLKWMIQANTYTESAFKKFLLKYTSTTLETRKDFLKLQAEYLVYIFKEKGHPSIKQVNEYRDHIVKMLFEEDDTFDKIQKEYTEELTKIDDQIYEQKRQILYNYMKDQLIKN
jgi:hypothetical protein